MGSEYIWGVHPFRDILVNSMFLDVDISHKNSKRDINTAFKYILENLLINRAEVVYLDFEISKNENHYKLIGKNAISALWLSGIIPSDATLILESSTFIIGDRKYKYNKRTKELTYSIIKN